MDVHVPNVLDRVRDGLKSERLFFRRLPLECRQRPFEKSECHNGLRVIQENSKGFLNSECLLPDRIKQMEWLNRLKLQQPIQAFQRLH